MSSAWDNAAAILERGTDEGVFPGACALVADRRGILFAHACGSLGIPGTTTPVDAHTVWDLASLTKPLATAAVTLIFVQLGLLRLDDRVVDVLPEFTGSGDARRTSVTVRHLLRHESGLPAHRRFYDGLAPEPAEGHSWDDRRSSLLRAVVTEPLQQDPGQGSIYSDIGFLVLGCMLEKVSGSRIDSLARRLLLQPLGVDEAWYVDQSQPSPLPLSRTAATGNCPWRGSLVHGFVQDQNAYAMGGVAAHAGLFATIGAADVLAREWIAASHDSGRVLDGRLVRYAWRSRPEGSSTWVLGWDTPSAVASSAGNSIYPQSVGHLGYTGTSLWIDRRRGVHVLLLTNRVASDTTGVGIRALRPRFHDAAWAAVDAGRRQ